MIVADASVVIDMLLGGRAGDSLAQRFSSGDAICAPHLLDAEVGQALRRFSLRSEMSVARAKASLYHLAHLPIRRFAHGELLPRAFAFRSNVTVYDGIYLALAEALEAPLLSCDAGLKDVPGCTAIVEILPTRGPHPTAP